MNKNQTNGLEYLQQLAFAHVASRVLAAGVCLNIFNVIPASGSTVEAIAQSTQTSLRGVRILLDTLASFQLLRKSGDTYFLTSVTRDYLRKDSPQYIGHLWERDDSMMPWNHLVDSIKTGKPWKDPGNTDDDNSFASLDRSLQVVNANAAEKAAVYLLNGHSGLNVLDVACGSGVWGTAIAAKDPQSRIVAHDFPPILKLTKHHAEAQHVGHQFTYLPGNLHKTDFGTNGYDLAILANILHYEGEASAQGLLKRCHAALKESGRLVIIDLITNEERTAPQGTVAFALVMLLGTSNGDVFTIRQYDQWIREAGFRTLETIDIGAPSPMLLAHKSAR